MATTTSPSMMVSSPARSLHAPLDPTASSSRSRLPEGGGGESSSPSSVAPSRAPSPTADELDPPSDDPMDNMDFYSTYQSSYTTAVAHHERGQPYHPRRKRAASHASFQDPSYLFPSHVGPSSSWSTQDKNLFFAALCRHGKLRTDLVAEELAGRKTLLEVVAYLQYLEMSTKLANAPGSSTARVNRKRKLWSLGMAPAAREVSDRWVELEEELADALLEREQAAKDKTKADTRQAAIDKIKSKGPARLSGRGPMSQKQRDTVAELDKLDRGWIRDDWSESLNPHKLNNIALELANPILSTYIDDRTQPKPLPEPIDRPEMLVRPMDNFLPPGATYEQIQEIVKQRTQVREDEKEELANKKKQYEREKKKLWKQMKEQVKRRRHRGGTRLQIAKIGVIDQYRQAGLDLFDLKGLGRHMSHVPTVAPETQGDQEQSQEIAYPTVVELKEQLRTYLTNLLQTSMTFRSDDPNHRKRSVVIQEDGKLGPPTVSKPGQNSCILTERAVREAQAALGGARWDPELVGGSDAEDDSSEGGDRDTETGHRTGDDADSSSDEEPIDLVSPSPGSSPAPEPQPVAPVSSRAPSTAPDRSSRASSLAVSDNEDCLSVLPFINPPIVLPLPVQPLWDRARTLPYRIKKQMTHPSDLLDQIRSLPLPKTALSRGGVALTLSALPALEPSMVKLDGWGNGKGVGEPFVSYVKRAGRRKGDRIVDESEEEDEDAETTEEDEHSDEWLEEDREDRIERMDRARDGEWERRVWETVEGMDEHGQGWADLGGLMDLDDDDLTVELPLSEDDPDWESQDDAEMNEDEDDLNEDEDEQEQYDDDEDPGGLMRYPDAADDDQEDGEDDDEVAFVEQGAADPDDEKSGEDEDESPPPPMRERSPTRSRSASMATEERTSENEKGDEVDEKHDEDEDGDEVEYSTEEDEEE